MKQRANLVLLATLISATAWGQEVSVYGTTMAQMWKQDLPGFDKASMMPATQFLGVDVTNMGTQGLSMHLFGWGAMDLQDASFPDGKKKDGDFTYGYVQYRFAQANADLKAGRFTVTEGGGMEQVDGVSGRTDLKHGFAVSFFAGTPVLHKPGGSPEIDHDYAFQRDIIFGTRFSMRVPKFGEVGLSYLQDGTKPAHELPVPSATDYTRKHLGLDLRVLPLAQVDLSGRTVFDLANHPATLDGSDRSKIAEHDYSLTVHATEGVSINGGFLERNFYAYYAGTTMPSLFKQDEKGRFRAFTGSVVVGSAANLQVTGDFRYTQREIYGTANRMGGTVKSNALGGALLWGAGYHYVHGTSVQNYPESLVASYSLSHHELRGWVMYEKNKLSSSLDCIYLGYRDENNPALNHKTSLYEVVASVGYRPNEIVKFSGDLGIGATPTYTQEVRGVLKAEFRFGMARKGGK